MERWTGRVALVTGASMGIGASICRRLVHHGMVVIGCARKVEKIKEIERELVESSAKGVLHAIQCDLAKEDEIMDMFEWIKSNVGGVDVCINNAGVAQKANLLGPETTAEKLRFTVNVNVVALCLCTNLAVQSMRERGVDDGQIIHINSMTGHRVIPNGSLNFYCATKHAVKAITEGHRQELRELQSNIRIAAISPGRVETDIFVNSSFTAEESRAILSSLKAIQPSDIADSVVYILSAPQHVQIHDILMRPTEQIS